MIAWALIVALARGLIAAGQELQRQAEAGGNVYPGLFKSTEPPS